VYYPSLADSTHESSDRYVSKIVNKDNLKERVKHHESLSLNVIDPDQSLFLYPLSERSIETIDREQRTKQCETLLNMKDPEKIKLNYVNVVVPFGGPTLLDKLHELVETHQVQQSMTDAVVRQLFFGLKNVFDGALALGRNNICHRDIKTDNISTWPRFRLAGFGLAVLVNGDLVHKRHLQFVNTVYEHWPLDYQVAVWYCAQSQKQLPDNKHWLSAPATSSQNDVAQIKTKLAKHFSWFQTGVSERANYVLSLNAAANIRDFKNTLLKTKSAALANYAVEKLDVYSLGIVVLNVAHVVQSCNRYHKLLQTIIKRFENLGLNMTHANPLYRPSMRRCWFSYMATLQDLVDFFALKNHYKMAAQLQNAVSK
jgi:serine/threonine protein kinase